ncbi:MAG: peroxiredoxin [Deltaproteobacteria bacterium]|jgi:peroxiredoxin Q/BCP|nr:peroxiredoxin [Deltaproteobacteria bacterium]
MLQTGEKFPAFELEGRNKKILSLKDLSGSHAVIYFYPKDNTGACSLEATEFSSLEGEFEKLGAKVLGVSPDGPESHEKFIAKKSLSVELLSDLGHDLLEKAGAWRQKKLYGREFMGVVRSTYLIDPEGRILFVWDKVKARGHARDVLEKLKEFAQK